MANKILVKYIKENLDKGYSIDDIKKAILDRGYSFQETEEAANSALTVSEEKRPAINKKWALLILAVIAGAFAFIFYISIPVYSSAADVFTDAFNRVSNIQTYREDFTTTIVYIIGSDQNSLVINGNTQKKGDKLKTVIEAPHSEIITIYKTSDGSYICYTDYCSELSESIDMFKPSETFFSRTSRLMDRDVINMEHKGTKNIINKPCNYLKITYNVDKLTEETYDDVLPGLADIATVTGNESNIDIISTVCLDQQTGMILEYIASMNMTMETEFGPHTIFLSSRINVNSLEINVNIPDSEFELPYSSD